MKILLTTDTFYPMINGVVISTNNLYQQLKKSGHDVKILTLSQEGKEFIDGDIYYLKSFGVKIYPGARAKFPFNNRLVNELVEWKPEIVHSQTEFSAMIISKKIAKKVGIPHLHTYHTMYEDYLKYIFNGRLITRSSANRFIKILLNTLDGVIVPTEKVKNALLNYGVKKNVHIIPTGIDINKFRKRITDAEKAEIIIKNSLQGKKILVYIGRIAEEKNIQEVITFFSNIVKQNYEFTLLIVGGGPYLENLMKLVDKLKLRESVKFTGMVAPDEVYKYYQLGRAFVTSSTSETQGLTYIEALASGTPVICRYDKCIQELIIDQETGFTYKNQTEFQNAVNIIISDDEMTKQFSINSKLKAEEYSNEVFAENVSEVYLKYLYS